jgi:hypothetical protein
MIKISYSRQQLLRDVSTATTTTTPDLYSSSEIMNQAIADIASLHADYSTMSLEQQIHREKALRAIFDADRQHHELDPTLLCRSDALAELAAQKQQEHSQWNTRKHGPGFHISAVNNPPRDPYFDDYSSTDSTTKSVPLPIPSSRVILSTYFGSRVDPNRCFELRNGKLAQDDASHLLHPLSDALHRLDLTAVIFHDDALSEEFVANTSAASKNLYFQRVELQREDWSLTDERWLIFSDWLRSPGNRNCSCLLFKKKFTPTIFLLFFLIDIDSSLFLFVPCSCRRSRMGISTRSRYHHYRDRPV